MFDEYEILEYLLKKAFKRVRISYGTIYRHFEVGSDDNDNEVSFEYKKSVNNFLTALERADRIIVNDVINNKIIPIYTILLYRKKDKLPSIGFYDVFQTRNREEYEKIAGDLIIQDAFESQNIKKKIFKVGMDILINDLNTRFPDKVSIDEFILSAKIYRNF